MDIDLYLFNAINSYAKKSRTLDVLAVFCAEYLGYALIAFLLVFAYATQNWQAFFIPLITGLISRFLINEIIYVFYKRKRPLEVIPANVLIKKPSHPAFPSGHTSFFFGLSLPVLMFNVPMAIAFIAVSAMVSLARVFSGVHWPSDILGGIGAALASFLFISNAVIR